MPATLTDAQVRALRYYGTPRNDRHTLRLGLPRWDVLRRVLAWGLIERTGDPTTYELRLTEAGRQALAVEAGRRGWSLPWHRPPYVGDGADGARRSAQIDLEEADTVERGTGRHTLLLESAARWEAQAVELEAAAGKRPPAPAPCTACVAGYPCATHGGAQ